MSLLSTDIRKVKRLSLREVVITAPVQPEELTPAEVEKPASNEEVSYSILVAINPLIEELVDTLNLVGSTGERIRKVELTEEEKPKPVNKLLELAQKIIAGESSYTQPEIVERIMKATNVNQQRAERGFTLLLQNGIIQPTINTELYYLAGSTPF